MWWRNSLNNMESYLAIKREFEQNSNPENAVRMENYMRNQFKFYGIKTPQRRAIYSELIKREVKLKRIDWIFLDTCYADEYREFQYFVTDYLKGMQRILRYEDVPKILSYAKKKQWWDTIDSFDRIIGKIGLKDNRIDDLMLDLSINGDFWMRRIAIDHQLSRKEDTNKELLEKIIVNNLGSNEFFINKAIGWSLRDYSKTNPEWVREFIRKHENKMNTLSIREASKYI